MGGSPFVLRNGRMVAVDYDNVTSPRSKRRYNAAFEDPALNAYLRAMGVEEASIRTGVRQQTRDAVRAWEVRQPLYKENLEEARQGIADDAEARGLYRSGATITRQAAAARDITRQYLGDRQAVTDAAAGFQRAGAEAVARLRRERAEQELSSRRAATERGAAAAYGARGRGFY